MSPRTGRPTEEYKGYNVRIRLSESDRKALEEGSKQLGVTMAEFIRTAIRKLADELSERG